MEKIMKEIKSNLNWKERIVLRLFKKTFLKLYNIVRINIVNNMIK